MPELNHDEAVSALQKIRQASDLADLAAGIAFRAKADAKVTKEVAEIAARVARDVARTLTRPLPLFDEADGMTPKAKGRGKAKNDPTPEPASEPAPPPPPWEDTLVSELAIPEEAIEALGTLGITTVGLMVKFMRAGCDWSIVPGMDASIAGRIDSVLIDFLERNQSASKPHDNQEGRAA